MDVYPFTMQLLDEKNTILGPGSEHRPLFVLSDLHLGDGRTAFARLGKEFDLFRFLDYVVRENGHLIVLGDLLELWRFSLTTVVDRWQNLLDRLDQMQAVYVPGNHDSQVASSYAVEQHPFFGRVYRPFELERGGKRLRFMHGHEIDPFIEKGLHENPFYMRCFHAVFDMRERMQCLGHEALADLGMGISEYLLYGWHWLTRVSGQVLHPELALQPASVLRHVRTHKILSRHCYHRDEAAYDIAITGHTHRVGHFNRWYFNSGCWVKPNNSFLKISPDAHVEVYDWQGQTPRHNPTVIG
ncbi:hypothetical protein ACFL6U_24415 [Planctomycetota bacterium]